MKNITYIALGSNLGDRLANLSTAIKRMPPLLHPLVNSSVYETPPWGYLEQPAFLNQVIRAETNLGAEQLLGHLKQIESDMGRQPGPRFGPRLIDLDILFYNELVLNLPGLTIPHPRLEGRAFVLVPLAEIAPALRHPILGKTILEMLKETDVVGITSYQD